MAGDVSKPFGDEKGYQFWALFGVGIILLARVSMSANISFGPFTAKVIQNRCLLPFFPTICTALIAITASFQLYSIDHLKNSVRISLRNNLSLAKLRGGAAIRPRRGLLTQLSSASVSGASLEKAIDAFSTALEIDTIELAFRSGTRYQLCGLS